MEGEAIVLILSILVLVLGLHLHHPNAAKYPPNQVHSIAEDSNLSLPAAVTVSPYSVPLFSAEQDVDSVTLTPSVPFLVALPCPAKFPS